MWSFLVQHFWCLLGALVGGALIGHGWRGLRVSRSEGEQEQLHRQRLDKVTRDFTERGLNIKALDARISTLEPALASSKVETERLRKLVLELEGNVRQQVDLVEERDLLLQRLTSEFAALQVAPPKIVERIVDRPVDRIVEKIVEKVVPKPVEVIRTVEVVKTVEIEKLVYVPAPLKPVARRATKDDLELIHGVGPKLAKFLNRRGITLFSQVGRWEQQDIDRLEADLPEFRGRIRREGWVKSAREEYLKKYGHELV
jgi:predicted flap endonuclease-1-like 5' DNA nuclease